MSEWRNIKIPLSWDSQKQFYLSIFQTDMDTLECVPVRRYKDGETILIGEPIRFSNSGELEDLLSDAHRGIFDTWLTEMEKNCG